MTQLTQAPRAAPTAAALQATLVELIDLSLQAKQAHWNVVGPNFRPLHEMLDEFADQYREWYDAVAERLTAIGVSPDGRVATISAQSLLDALPEGSLADRVLVPLIEDRLGDVTRRIRTRMEDLGEHDLVSQDLLIGVIHGLEKQRWMVHAQRV